MWLLIFMAFFILVVDCVYAYKIMSDLYLSFSPSDSIDIETIPNSVSESFPNLEASLNPENATFYVEQEGVDTSTIEDRLVYEPFIIDFYVFIDTLFHPLPLLESKSLDKWNRETYYVRAYILEVNSFLNTIAINIAYPSDKEFSNIWKEVKLDCEENNSAMVSSMNFELINSSINIFREAKVNDALFAYCLDEDCNLLGKSCILVNQQEINE